MGEKEQRTVRSSRFDGVSLISTVGAGTLKVRGQIWKQSTGFHAPLEMHNGKASGR